MKTAIIGAIAVALAFPVIGQAATPTDASTVSVPYGDLNLNRPADVNVLRHRLQTASLEACGASDFSFPEYRDAVRRSACYRASMTRALTAVNAPWTAGYGPRRGATAGE